MNLRVHHLLFVCDKWTDMTVQVFPEGLDSCDCSRGLLEFGVYECLS